MKVGDTRVWVNPVRSPDSLRKIAWAAAVPIVGTSWLITEIPPRTTSASGKSSKPTSWTPAGEVGMSYEPVADSELAAKIAVGGSGSSCQ